jgi:hypothetical protein
MAAIERKRPWYLVLGLLAALAFGANGARSGWGTVMLYHDPIDPSTAVQGLASEADRAIVVARVDAYLHALDAAKSRGWPLAVAALVLGLAQLFFAMRALGGSASARAALLQLVLAQAGLNIVSHVLMRDVIDADLRVLQASETASIHEQSLDKPRADEMMRAADAMIRVASPVVLALQLLGSAFIVLSLTRRRAREFYEPPAAAVRER